MDLTDPHHCCNDLLVWIFKTCSTVHLSEIARWGLTALEGDASVPEDPAIQPVFLRAREASGGTLLAIVDPVQKLVEAASGK